MATVTRHFASPLEMVDYLNDIPLTVPFVRITGLNTKTLLINDTVDDFIVTFSDPNNEGLTPRQIVSQINNTSIGEPATKWLTGASTVRTYDRDLVSKTARVAFVIAGYTIDKDGTANALLGLSTAADIIVGAGAIIKANIVEIVADKAGSRFLLTHV